MMCLNTMPGKKISVTLRKLLRIEGKKVGLITLKIKPIVSVASFTDLYSSILSILIKISIKDQYFSLTRFIIHNYKSNRYGRQSEAYQFQ